MHGTLQTFSDLRFHAFFFAGVYLTLLTVNKMPSACYYIIINVKKANNPFKLRNSSQNWPYTWKMKSDNIFY